MPGFVVDYFGTGNTSPGYGGLDANTKLLLHMNPSIFDLTIVGSFTTAGGSSANRITAYDGTNYSALGSGLDGLTLGVDVDGTDIYAAGIFSNAGGNPAVNIASWDGASWSAFGTGLNDYGRAVRKVGGTLYVGGDFTTADGVSASRVAKWNGTTFEPLGTGMSYAFTTTVAGIIDYQGNPTFIGQFTSSNGVTTNGITYWNGSTFVALGTGLSTPDAFGFTADGANLYVGGSFASAGGVANTAKLAKWDGASWSSLATTAPTNDIYGLAVAPNGDLYVTGDFTAIDGVSANRIAKYNGSTWSALGTGLNARGRDIKVAANGDVYVTGDFTTAGGTSAGYIAKWDGATWSAVGSGLDGAGYEMFLDSSGGFIDSSDSAHPVTANGDASINTTTFKFGGGAGDFDGTGDSLEVADSADFDFGTGDWCIDYQLRINTLPAGYHIAKFSSPSGWATDSTSSELRLWYNFTSTHSWTWSSSIDTWYHIAICRLGGNLHAYVNGSHLGSIATALTYNGDSNPLFVAARYNNTANSNILVDEVRISKGTARIDDTDDPLYIASGDPTDGFTPPTQEYERR
jgi:hypothetical protein